jgi:hypothetical protein
MKKYLIILCLFFIAGCGIFDTRDAEEPSQPRSNFIPPVRPEDVIANLVNSMKDLNVENYTACFSDSSFADRPFRFLASSTALSQFPIMSQGWGRREEQEYFINMKNKVVGESLINLEFFRTNIGSTQGDSLIFSASYTLNVPHNEPDVPLRYEGELSFSMIRDSRSYWSIYYWRDTKSNDLPSWSELKGRFY